MTSDEKIDAILKLCETQGKNIDRINRGLYGDPDNKLPGLIDRQISDEDRIRRLERHNDRQKWYLGGIGVAFMIAWEVVGDFVRSLFRH